MGHSASEDDFRRSAFKKVHTGVSCASCCVILLVLIFLAVAPASISGLGDRFKSLTEGLQSDMIFDISGSANPASASSVDFTVEPWKGMWPGSVDGCYCSASSRNRYDSGLKTRACNSTELGSIYCTNIPAQPAKQLSLWSSN